MDALRWKSAISIVAKKGGTMPALGLVKKQAPVTVKFLHTHNEVLLRRALVDWHRHQRRIGVMPTPPDRELSCTCMSEDTGDEYAVIQNMDCILEAVYVLDWKNHNKIIRLKTYPLGLLEKFNFVSAKQPEGLEALHKSGEAAGGVH